MRQVSKEVMFKKQFPSSHLFLAGLFHLVANQITFLVNQVFNVLDQIIQVIQIIK